MLMLVKATRTAGIPRSEIEAGTCCCRPGFPIQSAGIEWLTCRYFHLRQKGSRGLAKRDTGTKAVK